MGGPSTVADYRLIRQIGSGGMSVVYLAENARGERVAVKILDPHLTWEAEGRARFLKEAQHAASLDHPNVLSILDAGEADGRLFMTMPFVDGPDLASIIAEGPLEPSRTLAVLVQVSAALDFAHERGVIHRDVKPQNILVAAAGGHVYLTDFGLAKSLVSTSQRTATNQVIGTIDYVAPEHIANRRVDHRADIYALGCVLYECLTGHRPYERESDFQVLWAHTQDEPPSVRGINPRLSPRFDKIIAVALAKEPRARYSSCSELIGDVRTAIEDEVGCQTLVAERRRAERPKARPGRRAAGLLVGLLLVSAAFTGVMTAFHSEGRNQTNTPPPGARDEEQSQAESAPPLGKTQTTSKSALVRANARVSGVSSALEQPDPPESAAPAVQLHPAEIMLPGQGNYVYSMSGSNTLCGDQGELTVCPPREQLPTRMTIGVSREKSPNGDDMIILDRRWSGGSELSSNLRLTDQGAFITMTRNVFDYEGVQIGASFRLHPPAAWLRFPLRVGSSWNDRWEGPTKGWLAAEVVGKDSLRVDGRAIKTYRILSTTRFQGKTSGSVISTEWVDPTTNLPLRIHSDISLDDAATEYRAEFESKLLSGPGYS